MPIQQNPNKRRGEERSETLIIPHITREMLEVARAMAEKGASRAEIEAALAAMQTGKAPAAPAAPAPEKQPGAPQQAAPGRSDAARSGGIIPTSRPRYTAAERRAMLEEVQRRQAEREAARQAEAQAEEDRFRSYRDREYGRSPAVTPSAAPQPAATRRPQQLTRPARSRSRSAELPSLPPMPCSPLHPRHSPPSSPRRSCRRYKRRPLRHRLRPPRQSTPPTRNRPLRRSPKKPAPRAPTPRRRLP